MSLGLCWGIFFFLNKIPLVIPMCSAEYTNLSLNPTDMMHIIQVLAEFSRNPH